MMTRRKYKISRILSNIIRSARWYNKEALSKKCDFRCAPYWSSKAISVSMYSVIRFYLSRKTNLRKTFLRKSSGCESHHVTQNGYISTTQKNLKETNSDFQWIISYNLYEIIYLHWSVSLKTEIVRNSAIGRMISICHFWISHWISPYLIDTKWSVRQKCVTD